MGVIIGGGPAKKVNDGVHDDSGKRMGKMADGGRKFQTYTQLKSH